MENIKNRTQIIINLFLVYISWGSFYVCNKFVIPVFGPFLTSGSRMIIGGTFICLFLLFRNGFIMPSMQDFVHAVMMGFFMVLMAAGFLSKGQENILSSTAAVITGSVPITMLVAGWLFANEPRPRFWQWMGLVIGFCGLTLLAMGQVTQSAAREDDLLGISVVFVATLGWIAGTLITRRFPRKTCLPDLEQCAVMMIFGGGMCLLAGILTGESAVLDWQRVEYKVLLSYAWLCTGASITAYTCYFWLIKHTTIAVAISYEYVVPVLGVLLGWQVGGEAISPRMWIGCAMTISSVFFIVRQRGGE